MPKHARSRFCFIACRQDETVERARKAASEAKARLEAVTAKHEADKRSAVTFAQRQAQLQAEATSKRLEEEYQRELQSAAARNAAILSSELHRLHMEKEAAMESVRAALLKQQREQEIRSDVLRRSPMFHRVVLCR